METRKRKSECVRSVRLKGFSLCLTRDSTVCDEESSSQSQQEHMMPKQNQSRIGLDFVVA